MRLMEMGVIDEICAGSTLLVPISHAAFVHVVWVGTWDEASMYFSLVMKLYHVSALSPRRPFGVDEMIRSVGPELSSSSDDSKT